MKGKSSVEIKINNIKKLMNRVKRGRITLKEAEINRRLDILSKEGSRGEIWANDLRIQYIEMVRNLNNS